MIADYSIVIPAWNEAEFLPLTLARLKSAMEAQSRPGEIIVADNNSSDATAAVARASGAKVVFEAKNNISRARNAGASVASGTILLFIDADTLVSPELLTEILERMFSGKYYAGGAAMEFDMPVPWFGRVIVSSWNSLAPRRGWAAGCCLYCLKEAFERVGGFSPERYAAEELYLCRALRTKRGKLEFSHISDFPVVSSARKMQRYSMFRLFSQMLLLGFFPFLLRYKSACSIWYEQRG